MGKKRAGESWIKIIKEREFERSFRENEPVIRDDADAWMIRLNELRDGSYDDEHPYSNDR